MKKPHCKGCGKDGHYETFCYFKRKKQPKARATSIKPIGQRLSKQEAKDREFKLQWIQDNTDGTGTWECYLQIASLCPRILTVETLTIEHVIPKGRGKKYRYNPKNIKPACTYCNGLKGSQTLEVLVKTYPQLQKFIVDTED